MPETQQVHSERISQMSGEWQKMLDELRRDFEENTKENKTPVQDISDLPRPLTYKNVCSLSTAELFQLLHIHTLEESLIIEELLHRKEEKIEEEYVSGSKNW